MELFEDVFSDSDLEQTENSLKAPFPKFIDGVDDAEGSLAPFLTTSKAAVREALGLAKRVAEEHGSSLRGLLELGSGDGRFCVAALLPPSTVRRAVGIEVDPDLAQLSAARARRCGVAVPDQLAIVCGSVLDVDLNLAALAALPSSPPGKDPDGPLDELVVVLYLLGDRAGQAAVAERLEPLYRRGATIVSLVFPLSTQFALAASAPGISVYRRPTT